MSKKTNITRQAKQTKWKFLLVEDGSIDIDELGWVNKKLFRCAKCLAAKVEETKLQPKFKPGDKVYITEYRYNSETCDLDHNEIGMTITDVVIENNTILYITDNNPFVKTEEKYFHRKQE